MNSEKHVRVFPFSYIVSSIGYESTIANRFSMEWVYLIDRSRPYEKGLNRILYLVFTKGILLRF